jgi:ATP-dependent helicase/nuclease subunit A
MIIAFNNKKSKPKFRLDEQTSCLRQNYYDAEDELSTILKYSNEETIKEGLKISNTYIKAILDIINEYLKRLHEYKTKNEIYDFQDIALLSIKILKENESVREELKENFKEIMVDEYQDTNDIQEAFISMIENNNVYMVGDIKQSIYRFRNANPYIFKNKYDAYKNNENGVKIDLLDNFRSREEVLKGINDIFDLIMDNNIGGAEYKESHRMVFGNTSYIEKGKTNQDYKLEILEYPYDKESEYSEEEIEAFTIARDIQDKIKNKYQVFDKDSKVLKEASYSDFVILIDRGASFELYKKIFEYLGIPLTIFKEEKFNNSDEIYIIKNIIDLIVNIHLEKYDQEFKYDFISIARSYLYDYDDEKIFNYFLNNNFTESTIYDDFKDIANNLSHLSISELLEYIITKTNMYEKLITVGGIDTALIRLSKLIDIADNLSSLGYNIYSFRDYLKELIENKQDMNYEIAGTNANSVRIMTIHKSKGLEYHVCYYPGLYKEFNIRELNDRFLFSNKYGIVTPVFQDGIQDTIIKYLLKYHYIEEEIGERIRLFYVALTRAKEKMILITPSLEESEYELDPNGTIEDLIRRKYRSFSQILESIKFKINKYYKEIDINDLDITREYKYIKIKEKELTSTKEPLTVEEITIPESSEIESKHFSKTTHNLIDKRIYDNMQFGLKAHEIFEFIDLKNPNYDLIEDEFLKGRIKEFLDKPLLNQIKDAKIYKEHEFIYEEDLEEYHGIIDLMLEYDNKIDIIDYKLNNVEDENYLKQLNGYKEYISKLSNKEISIYLYSIISGELKKL